MAEAPSCTLREARFEDYEAASALLSDLGLSMPAGSAARRSHWEHLWVSNPALQGDGPKPPLGWVLEHRDQMCGFFGNIPLLYDFAGRPILVANASAWGVQRSYRAHVPRLAAAYFEQSVVDLWMVTTGIKPTGRIFERHEAVRMPQPDYDKILYWVTGTVGFLRAALRKKNLPPAAAAVGAVLGGPLLTLRLLSRPAKQARAVDVITVDEVDDAFDELWERKRTEARRLMACRDARSIRWHFEKPYKSEETIWWRSLT